MNIPNVFFFLLLSDVICGLRGSQGRLVALTDQVEANSDKILDKKWKLRFRTMEANRFFQVSLTLLHLQLFSWMLFLMSEAMKRSLDGVSSVILITGTVCSFFQLAKVVLESSRLIESCREAEKILLKQSHDVRVDQDCLKRVLAVVHFDENWDCLRAAFSPMDGSNFVKFLIASLTCAAVVLQFDYVVMREINQLSSKH